MQVFGHMLSFDLKKNLRLYFEDIKNKVLESYIFCKCKELYNNEFIKMIKIHIIMASLFMVFFKLVIDVSFICRLFCLIFITYISISFSLRDRVKIFFSKAVLNFLGREFCHCSTFEMREDEHLRIFFSYLPKYIKKFAANNPS